MGRSCSPGLLVLVHAGVAALWLGAMAYSLFTVQPKLRRDGRRRRRAGRGRPADPGPRQPLAGGRPDRRALGHRHRAGRHDDDRDWPVVPPRPSCSPPPGAVLVGLLARLAPPGLRAAGRAARPPAPVPRAPPSRMLGPGRRRVRAQLPQRADPPQPDVVDPLAAGRAAPSSPRSSASWCTGHFAPWISVGEHHHVRPPVAPGPRRAAARSAVVDRRHDPGLRHVVEQLRRWRGAPARSARARRARRGRGRSRTGSRTRPAGATARTPASAARRGAGRAVNGTGASTPSGPTYDFHAPEVMNRGIGSRATVSSGTGSSGSSATANAARHSQIRPVPRGRSASTV